MMINRFLIHCFNCSRGQHRHIEIKKDDYQEISCDNCGSKKVAVWQDDQCQYSYSGKVEYPFGKFAKVGDPVRGPVSHAGEQQTGQHD